MIEPLADFGREHAIEKSEVDHHAGLRVDRRAHGDVAHVTVAMVALARTETEDPFIALVGPIGAAVAMSGRKCDAASEIGGQLKVRRGKRGLAGSERLTASAEE